VPRPRGERTRNPRFALKLLSVFRSITAEYWLRKFSRQFLHARWFYPSCSSFGWLSSPSSSFKLIVSPSDPLRLRPTERSSYSSRSSSHPAGVRLDGHANFRLRYCSYALMAASSPSFGTKYLLQADVRSTGRWMRPSMAIYIDVVSIGQGKKMQANAQKILDNDENRAPRGFDDRGVFGIPGRGLLASAPDAPSTESFSTDDLAENDRVAMWREHFGRRALRVECEPTGERPFEACVTSRSLPGLHVLFGRSSAARLTRTRELTADGNDDFILVVSRAGNIAVSARGRELSLREGDALLGRSDEVTVFESRSHSASLWLRIPRSILSSLLVDDATMRPIPRQSEALKLLTSYTMALTREHALTTSELQHLVVSHVSDLAGLALGATADAACTARIRGLPAARLRAAKTYIIENSGRRDLSIGLVAAQLGVTPRSLQRLFEADGTTFSTWLLNQRLVHAHRMLCKPELARQPVSAIAGDVGFGDPSHFNRCFRKMYGVTPKEVREAATK
jgi:AraC-like DNA-binding protein